MRVKVTEEKMQMDDRWSAQWEKKAGKYKRKR